MKITGEVLSKDSILQMNFEGKKKYIQKVHVAYKREKDLIEKITNCVDVVEMGASQPPGLMLIGESGVGKSNILSQINKLYPRGETPEGSAIITSLRVVVPVPTTVGMFVTSILNKMRDPMACTGSIGMRTYRLEKLLAACRVKLIMFDEVQHLIDSDRQKVVSTVADCLKILIKENQVACVLCGLHNTKILLDAHEQLGRLFPDPEELEPFMWDEKRPGSEIEFRAFLDDLDNLLPLRNKSHLANIDLARRIYTATRGKIGYIMELVRTATVSALIQNREELTISMLSDAFENRLAGKRMKVKNPFRD
jgi:energy-coupling factor transporter ATP-binding protein EcfA2